MIYMSKAAEIVARANACLGLTRIQLGILGYHAWCAHFVSEVLRYVGIDMYDLSCTRMQAKMDDSKDWDEPDDLHPIPGDILFFDWDHKPEELPLDHVGIVTGYSNGTITYVNGNGNSSFYVTRQTISIHNSCIAYWMRYVGRTAVPSESVQKEIETPKPSKVMCTVELEQLSRGCESASVETLQNLLRDVQYDLEVDGRFGEETEKYAKEFQKDNDLTADGIVGAKTWKALIEAV
jgi:hypothetical protein